MFIRSLFVLSLSATLGAAAHANAPTTARPLQLVVPDLLVPGQAATIVVRNATPGAAIALVSSDGVPAPGECLSQLNGACLDLTPGALGYRMESRAQANAQGVATWTFVPEAGLTVGSRIGLQAVEPARRALSAPWVGEAGRRNACVDDGREDHDVIVEPELMRAGDAIDAVACPGDADTYAIRVAPGEFVRFGAMFDHFGDGDIELSLYDRSGSLLDSSRSSEDFEQVSWRNSRDVDTWVIAHALAVEEQGGLAGARYQLTVDKALAQPCAPDALEPDSSAIEAVHPPHGQAQQRTACEGDVDWIAYDVAAGELLRVELQSPAGDGVLGVKLHDAAGRELQRARSDEQGRVKLELMAEEASSVRVSVRPLVSEIGQRGVSYRLRAEQYEPALCPVDGLSAGGSMLPLGVSEALGVCEGEPLDVFAVDLIAGALLEVEIDFLHDDGDIDLYLVDYLPTTAADLAAHQLVRSATTEDRERLTFRAPADGRYFVVVRLAADGDDTTWAGARYDMVAEIR
jgi:hypothetical protein